MESQEWIGKNCATDGEAPQTVSYHWLSLGCLCPLSTKHPCFCSIRPKGYQWLERPVLSQRQGLLDSSLLSLQSGRVRLFEGTLINSFHEANQHEGLGLCVGAKEANFISVTPSLRNISKPHWGGHLHAVQSVFPRASEQVVFNQGLQVLVCEILCFEGRMLRVRRRRVISVQTSGILCSLVTSDDVLVNTYRKANLY